MAVIWISGLKVVTEVKWGHYNWCQKKRQFAAHRFSGPHVDSSCGLRARRRPGEQAQKLTLLTRWLPPFSLVKPETTHFPSSLCSSGMAASAESNASNLEEQLLFLHRIQNSSYVQEIEEHLWLRRNKYTWLKCTTAPSRINNSKRHSYLMDMVSLRSEVRGDPTVLLLTSHPVYFCITPRVTRQSWFS